MVNPGCGCCSYVTVESFKKYSEAKELLETDPDNYCIEHSFTDEEVGEMQSTIERVRELHKHNPDWDSCDGCLDVYPCPTIKALDGEQ